MNIVMTDLSSKDQEFATDPENSSMMAEKAKSPQSHDPESSSGSSDSHSCWVYLKQHKRGNDVVYGICDAELLGRVLKQGKFQYKVAPHFFEGVKIPLKKALVKLQHCTNLNAVGPHTIKLLIEKKLIHKDAIVRIEGVPVALKFIF